MEIRVSASVCSRQLLSPQAELQHVTAQMTPRLPRWEQELKNNPSKFRKVERKFNTYLKKSVFVLPAMVQSSSQSDEVLAKVQELQDHHSVEKPRNQRVMIRFLCGAIFQVVTFYCPPKRRSAKDENVPEERHGISPEFSLYGFVKGCSPALEEKVARASAFYPSFSVAKEELSREDVETDVKTVSRISMGQVQGFVGQFFWRVLSFGVPRRLALLFFIR